MANPNIVSVATIRGKTDSAASGIVYKINSIVVTNVAGTDTTFRISFYDGTTDRFLAYNVTCPANTVVIVTDKNSSLYLEEGDSIRGGASTTSRLDYVISYETIA